MRRIAPCPRSGLQHPGSPAAARSPRRFAASPLALAIGAFYLAKSPLLQAACTPASPYGAGINVVVCDPGVGESPDTLGNHDRLTLQAGTLGTVRMGTGNDVLELNGGVVNTVLQDNETGSQGDDTALIQGGSILGKLDQAGGNDILSLTGGQVVDVDQGSGSDTATLSGGTITGRIEQGSGADTLTVSGGWIETIDQGNFGDTLTIQGGRVGSISQGTGDDT